MTKIMLNPEANALDRILKAQNTSQLELSKKGFGRATLKKINDGLPTKEGTLIRVAEHLNVPLSHLLPSVSARPVDSPAEQNRLGVPVVYSSDGSVIQTLEMYQLNTDSELVFFMRSSHENIEWNLATRTIDADDAENLKRFEKKLMEIVSPDQDTDESCLTLTGQLEKVVSYNELDTLVDELKRKGIYVYAGVYTYWGKSREIPYGWEPPVWTDFYVSMRRLRFRICREDESSIREPVSIGHPPPKEIGEGENPIFINGRILEYLEVDDIPF